MAATNAHSYSIRLYPERFGITVSVLETTWHPGKGQSARQVMSIQTDHDDVLKAVNEAALCALAMIQMERDRLHALYNKDETGSLPSGSGTG